MLVVKFSVFSNHLKRYLSKHAFDYERVDSHSRKWSNLIGHKVTQNYIPVTRIQLADSIAGDIEKERSTVEGKEFRKFAFKLDSLLQNYHRRRLKSLKSLYNPISPDRVTVQMKYFSENQLTYREESVLENITELLTDAAFYELPKDIIRRTLNERDTREKLDFQVDLESFDVLRIWVIGLDLAPLDKRSILTKAKQKKTNMNPQDHVYHDSYFTKYQMSQASSQERIERYKRVIVAFREQDDTKLHLKAFKDIPCNDLEFLLPGGQLKMRSNDKLKVSALTMLLMSVYGIGLSTSYKIPASVATAVTLCIILFRSWSYSRNLKNKYIINVSKTLYFKSIASNHALLTLLTDRAEEEIYKCALLICAALALNDVQVVTQSELDHKIRRWLKIKFEINSLANLSAPIEILKSLNILEVEQYKEDEGIKANSFEQMALAIPSHLVQYRTSPDELCPSIEIGSEIKKDESDENFKWE